jgi:hypothetical protein
MHRVPSLNYFSSPPVSIKCLAIIILYGFCKLNAPYGFIEFILGLWYGICAAQATPSHTRRIHIYRAIEPTGGSLFLAILTLTDMSFRIPFFIEAISCSSIVINHAASTAPKELTTIHEGTPEFKETVRSMAEECLLFRYHDIYYNIPGALMPVEFPSSLTPFQNKSKMGN